MEKKKSSGAPPFSKVFWLGLIFLFPICGVAQGILYDDPSFTHFSDSLISAVQKNDTMFVFSRVSEDVSNGFGGNVGIKEFKQMWSGLNEPLRKEIVKALKLGAKCDEPSDRVFVPHYWLTFPDSLDAFRYVYVLKNGVPAYALPDTSAPIVETIDAGLIKIVSYDVSDKYAAAGNPVWAGLESSTGDTLMVLAEFLRSPLDYRFWFEKKEGRWMLMGWAAGD